MTVPSYGYMFVIPNTDRPLQSTTTHKRVEPTSNAGRLFGTLYNTDWRALLEKANGQR